MQTIEIAEQMPAETPTRRRWYAWAGAAAAVVLAVVGGTAVLRDGGGSPAPAPRDTLRLAAPGGDGTSISSCVAFDVAFLRDMPVAFGGTAVAVTPSEVVIDVDRWYKGGTADVVTVTNETGGNVSIEGVDFTVGQRYLVTATDGAVNACGFSGPATPQLESAFEQAFPR